MASETSSRLYWSVAEAAAYLGFSEQTLYKWLRKYERPKTKRKSKHFDIPDPPRIRFGKTIRIPIAEFKQWAATTDQQRKVQEDVHA